MAGLNRLYRSRKNRIIGGVAGGLAEYFQVDVVIIRLLWVVAVFLGGGGILAYIIAWIVIPEENPFVTGESGRGAFAPPEKQSDGTAVFHGESKEDFTSTEENRSSFKRQRSAGLLLIGLGIIFLARELIGPFIYYFWPLLIIAAGIFLLMRSVKGAG